MPNRTGRAHRALRFIVALLLTTLGVSAGGTVATTLPAGAAVNETLLVDSRNPAGSMTSSVLQAGTAYSITIEGTYLYTAGGIAGQGAQQWGSSLGDAECTELRPDPTWQPNRWVLLDPLGDVNDVYINDTNVAWKAVRPDGFGCDPNHKYTYTLVPDQTGPVNFKVHEANAPSWTDNFGGFTVRISEISGALDTFTLNAAAHGGATNNVDLLSTKNYKIEISGTYLPSYNVSQLSADAECTSWLGAPGLTENQNSAIETSSDTGDDMYDVYLNGTAVAWTPSNGSPTGCNDSNHTYEVGYRPPVTGRVNLRVYDSFMNDNIGSFTVKIYEVETAPAAPAPLPTLALAEEVNVNSSNPQGASNLVPLIAGREYLFEVSGLYGWGAGGADAECSFTLTQPQWLRDRFANISPDVDLLDLLVNDKSVNWTPTHPNPDGCNTLDHTYRLIYKAPTTQFVNFKTATSHHGINFGTLQVKIFHITEVVTGVTRVDATSAGGNPTTPLVAGANYRLVSDGTWAYWTGNGAFIADAECSQTDTSPMHPNYWASFPQFDQYDDLLDLGINGQSQNWKAVSGAEGTCDANHSYETSFQAKANGPVSLGVIDVTYHDNGGSLTVTVFRRLS